LYSPRRAPLHSAQSAAALVVRIAGDARFDEQESIGLMDFDVQKSTRTCAATSREITAGETYFSVLVREGADVRRLDYAEEAWPGPPANSLGWWKSTMPDREGAGKKKLAPSEVLLELFRELGDAPDRIDLRYVLTLLLIRRRLLRLEETVRDEAVGEGSPGGIASAETMVLYCPRDEQTYRVAVVEPDERRVEEIQAYLAQLLYAPGA